MSDFLSNLLARSFEEEAALAPRLPSRFEQLPIMTPRADSLEEEDGAGLGLVSPSLPSVTAPPERPVPHQPSQTISVQAPPVRDPVVGWDDEPVGPPVLRQSPRPAPPTPSEPRAEQRDQGEIRPRSIAPPQAVSQEREPARPPRVEPASPLPSIVAVPPLPEFPTESRPVSTLAPAIAGDPPRPVVNRLEGVSMPQRETERPPGREPPTISSPVQPRPRPDDARLAARQSQASAPTIRVTIGRIEVRAAAPAPSPAPAAPRARQRPSLLLDDYLKQRGNGRK